VKILQKVLGGLLFLTHTVHVTVALAVIMLTCGSHITDRDMHSDNLRTVAACLPSEAERCYRRRCVNIGSRET